MTRPIAFILSATILLLFNYSLLGARSYNDAFKSSNINLLSQLSGESSLIRRASKMTHALNSSRFDIGLFGNSRSLEFGKKHLLNQDLTFFNFSIGGESIRNSVQMLETLAKYGKTPRLAIVSVDNFDLQFYSNSSAAPFLMRLKYISKDFLAGIKFKEISIYQIGKMIWRHLWIEYNLLKQRITVSTANALRDKLVNPWINPIAPPNPRWATFLADGSRPVHFKPRPNPAGILFTSVRPQVLDGYLLIDLLRLSKLNDEITQIVLYESPLIPNINFDPNNAWHKSAQEDRTLFYSTCLKLKLVCLQFAMPDSVPTGLWRDSSHAPPEFLGYLLNSKIGQLKISKTQ